MALVNVCPAGHSQDPKFGPDGKTVISGPRQSRPGRCHFCGAVLSQFEDGE